MWLKAAVICDRCLPAVRLLNTGVSFDELFLHSSSGNKVSLASKNWATHHSMDGNYLRDRGPAARRRKRWGSHEVAILSGKPDKTCCLEPSSPFSQHSHLLKWLDRNSLMGKCNQQQQTSINSTPVLGTQWMGERSFLIHGTFLCM